MDVSCGVILYAYLHCLNQVLSDTFGGRFGYVYGVSCVSDMLPSVLKCIGSV